jgi:hypothetical protein
MQTLFFFIRQLFEKCVEERRLDDYGRGRVNSKDRIEELKMTNGNGGDGACTQRKDREQIL